MPRPAPGVPRGCRRGLSAFLLVLSSASVLSRPVRADAPDAPAPAPIESLVKSVVERLETHLVAHGFSARSMPPPAASVTVTGSDIARYTHAESGSEVSVHLWQRRLYRSRRASLAEDQRRRAEGEVRVVDRGLLVVPPGFRYEGVEYWTNAGALLVRHSGQRWVLTPPEVAALLDPARIDALLAALVPPSLRALIAAWERVEPPYTAGLDGTTPAGDGTVFTFSSDGTSAASTLAVFGSFGSAGDWVAASSGGTLGENGSLVLKAIWAGIRADLAEAGELQFAHTNEAIQRETKLGNLPADTPKRKVATWSVTRAAGIGPGRGIEVNFLYTPYASREEYRLSVVLVGERVGIGMLSLGEVGKKRTSDHRHAAVLHGYMQELVRAEASGASR